ncbi:MAG: hypothetical protein AB9842_01445 [Bacteroidales bacterium]
MVLKFLSDFIPENKLRSAEWYSYFLRFTSVSGEQELLPSDNHSAAYPLLLDRNKNIISGKVNFFNSSFYKGFSKDKLNSEKDLEFSFIPAHHDRCLIINILDNCFGHSLLKLFNIPLFYKECHDKYDIFIISPASLTVYLCKEKLNIIGVKKSFSALGNGLILTDIIEKIKLNYTASEYAFLNTYQDYQDKSELIPFFNFTGSSAEKPAKKNIIFYYRKDRLRRWGLFSQKARIINFFNFLKSFFNNVDFILLGEKDNLKFPGFIKDMRCNSFTEETEFTYNRLLKNSLFVTGVHGSHLILPSLLSRQVFHLVPPIKIKNTGEDVFNIRISNIEACYRDFNIFLPGSVFPGSGKKTAKVVLVLFLSSLQKEYKMSEPIEGYNSSQEEYILKKYPEFFYGKALNLWDSEESRHLRIFKLIRGRS